MPELVLEVISVIREGNADAKLNVDSKARHDYNNRFDTTRQYTTTQKPKSDSTVTKEASANYSI